MPVPKTSTRPPHINQLVQVVNVTPGDIWENRHACVMAYVIRVEAERNGGMNNVIYTYGVPGNKKYYQKIPLTTWVTEFMYSHPSTEHLPVDEGELIDLSLEAIGA